MKATQRLQSACLATVMVLGMMMAPALGFAAKSKDEKKVAMSNAASVSKKAPAASPLEGWHLGVEAMLNVPLDIGGRLVLEMPGRFRVATSLGVLPTSFVGVINGAMVGAGVYNSSVASALESSLGDSLVWRLHGEWRPFAGAGFYFGGGYGLVHFNGNANVAALAGLSGLSIPASYQNAISFKMSATLHMLNAELGWEWTMFKIATLRLAAGFMGTVGSSTQIQVQASSAVPASAKTSIQNNANTAAAAIDNAFRSYVFSPYISLSTGIRFF